MKITFDPAFDQGYWPGPLSDRDAVSGELWFGPPGMKDTARCSFSIIWGYSGVLMIKSSHYLEQFSSLHRKHS